MDTTNTNETTSSAATVLDDDTFRRVWDEAEDMARLARRAWHGDCHDDAQGQRYWGAHGVLLEAYRRVTGRGTWEPRPRMARSGGFDRHYQPEGGDWSAVTRRDLCLTEEAEDVLFDVRADLSLHGAVLWAREYAESERDDRQERAEQQQQHAEPQQQAGTAGAQEEAN